jgi:hypothetical protein
LRFSAGSCASLSAFLTHVMYARWGCPAFMHPHVCSMLTRACSTSAASEHFLLTQVASAGLVAPNASSTTRTPARDQLMDPPSNPSLVGRYTLESDTLRSGTTGRCQVDRSLGCFQHSANHLGTICRANTAAYCRIESVTTTGRIWRPRQLMRPALWQPGRTRQSASCMSRRAPDGVGIGVDHGVDDGVLARWVDRADSLGPEQSLRCGPITGS